MPVISPTEEAAVEAGREAPVAAPADGEVIAAGQPVQVALNKSADGPAEALVYLDSQPPQKVSAGGPAIDLAAAGPGAHVLRVVPLQQGHVDLGAGALTVRTFTIGGAAASVAGFDPKGAILTVGEPFGEVKRDADGMVPFSFRVDNHVISETGARVKWSVDGGEVESLFEYPPLEDLTIGPLEPGEHTLKVWIENGDGTQPQNGGLTQVERTFTVR